MGSDMKIISAGLIIYRNGDFEDKNTEFLLLQASYPPHHWTPPKGKIEEGESLMDAAIRETHEESGLKTDVFEIDKEFLRTLKYSVAKVPKEVTYFLARVKRVAHSQEIKLSDEHQDFAWLSLEKAIALVTFEDLKTLLKEANDYINSNASKR